MDRDIQYIMKNTGTGIYSKQRKIQGQDVQYTVKYRDWDIQHTEENTGTGIYSI
jgi:hypothetical protein